MTSARLALRGAATTPALSVFVVLVIAVLSYLGVAAPLLLENGRTATIERAATALPIGSRWVVATAPGVPRIDAAPTGEAGVWGSSAEVIDSARTAQPEPLRSLLGPARLTLAIDPAPSVDPDPEPTAPVPINKVRLVADIDFADRVRVHEGRLPRATDPAQGIEIALTRTVAERLAWSVGADRVVGAHRVRLIGTVIPTDEQHGDWAFLPGALTPTVEVSSSGDEVLVGTAFLHVDEIAALPEHIADARVTAWMPVHTDRIRAADARRLVAQLRFLAADPVTLPLELDEYFSSSLSFSSGLPRVIEAGAVRGDAMTAVVAVAGVGPAAVAIVVLGLLTRLIAVRRLSAVRVLRARGASTRRLISQLAGEGAGLGLLGALAGSGVAALSPGWLSGWVLLAPVALAAVPAVMLPWSVLRDAAQKGRSDFGEQSRRSRARPILELAILAVTVMLTALLATRPSGGSADPALLALPVLLGAAGSILCLRLLPVVLLIAERRGRARSALSPLLGPARARRDPPARVAPVLAIVIGVGVAVFSVAFASTVSNGITRSAAADVGADLRVDASYITDDAVQRVSELTGVAELAALRGDSTEQATSGSARQRAHVYTVDSAELARVQHGLPGALALPEALSRTDQAEAVPVVASRALLAKLGVPAEDLDDPKTIEDVEINGRPVRIVATAPAQVSFGSPELWVIVDTANARALGQRNLGLTQLYIAVGATAPDDVGEEAVRAVGGDATFVTPARNASVYEQDPAFSVVQGSLLAAGVIVAVLLAASVAAMLVLSAASRARMLAVLRALGHPSRGEGRLVAWEIVPALLLALPFGAGIGALMAGVVIAQLDLRGFVGGQTQPSVELGGMWPLVVVSGFAVLAALAVLVATVLASRFSASLILHADDDGRER